MHPLHLTRRNVPRTQQQQEISRGRKRSIPRRSGIPVSPLRRDMNLVSSSPSYVIFLISLLRIWSWFKFGVRTSNTIVGGVFKSTIIRFVRIGFMSVSSYRRFLGCTLIPNTKWFIVVYVLVHKIGEDDTGGRSGKVEASSRMELHPEFSRVRSV